MGLLLETEVLPREGRVDDVPVEGQDFVVRDRARVREVVDPRFVVGGEQEREGEEVVQEGRGVLERGRWVGLVSIDTMSNLGISIPGGGIE